MGLAWLIGILLVVYGGELLFASYTPRSELRAKIEQKDNEINWLKAKNKDCSEANALLKNKLEEVVRLQIERWEKHKIEINNLKEQHEFDMCEYKDDMADIISEYYEKKYDKWIEEYEKENVKK